MNIEKRKLLMNSFFNAQFNYCLLIWMIHSRYNNNKIKNLHERCLRLTCCDKTSSYEKLIEKDDSVSIHLEIETSSLEIEIYKVKNELAPTITVNILVQFLKTIIISKTIMILGFLFQEQFTMLLKHLLSRTKIMGYCSYRVKKSRIP